jgi:hypothetical protein
MLVQVEKLQEKFASIHHHLSSVQPIPNVQQETIDDFARLNVR